MKYRVPKSLLGNRKGGLAALRLHLVSIGFPLANNEEYNVGDSVIRLSDRYLYNGSWGDGDDRVYDIISNTEV